MTTYYIQLGDEIFINGGGSPVVISGNAETGQVLTATSSTTANWQPSSTVWTTFYVDASNHGVTDGSVIHPYQTIQQAVEAAHIAALPNISIELAIGVYTDAVNLYQDVNYAIIGAISGFNLIEGDITWSISGNALPISQSGLVLRNLLVNNIIITDGSPVSISSTLVLENCFLTGHVIQTGTGILNALVSGISTAASAISGPVVSSAIAGSINLPYANLGITNTQLNGDITCNKLWTQGCQLAGGSFTINIAGTLADIQQSFFVNAPTIVFQGSAGTLSLDSSTGTDFFVDGGTLTNGVMNFLSPVIIKSVATFDFPTTTGDFQVVGATVTNAAVGDALILNYDYTLISTYLVLGATIDTANHVNISFLDINSPNDPINVPVTVTIIKSSP